MEELSLADQTASFDRYATQAAYSLIEGGDADQCGCDPCRNFALQRINAYPPEFHSLLDRLGIDALKEGEAVHYGPESSDRHVYGGWFYFVGTIAVAGKRQIGKDAFNYWIGTSFPEPPTPFQGQPVLALEFMTQLPWVLPEPAE